MRKRFFRVAISTMLIGSMLASTVSAAPSINQIQEQRDEAKEEVASLQSQLAKVLSQINELEEKLIAKGQEIVQATEDLEAAEKKEKEQYEAMKLRIKYMYEEGSTSAIEKMMGSGTIGELLSQAEYVQNVHTYDRKQLQEYVETKEEIEELKVKLETEQAELEAAQVEFTEKQEALDATIAEKQEEVDDLDAQFQAAVEQAAREAEERQQQANNSSNNNSSGSSSSGSSSSSNSSSGSSSSGSSSSSSSSSGSSSSSSSSSNSNVSVGTGSTAKAQAIVSAAQSYLGIPYVWGGESLSGMDCSGLVWLAHRAAGISVARTSGSLGSGGKSVSESEAKPGDVVCYSGHVGIYVGNGQMIHAPRPGKVVCYTNVNYRTHWFKRYW